MIGMVHHLGCHAAVHDEILPAYEARIITCQKESHSSYVFGPAYSSGWMLAFVLFGMARRGGGGLERSGVNPTGTDGVDADSARQTCGQCVGQRTYAALSR